MSAQVCGCNACGCDTMPCGCCDGVEKLTPADETNRPGLSALRYRVGTHAQFLETMKARLSTIEVDGVSSDGQTPATFRPLQGLTTRDGGDPSIALLDAWATVGDVLSFYQERIANENYLRTATERRSILELARLVGYRLRPGVAASTFFAYTIDDKQAAPLTIPAGSAAQSVPNPGEQPQTFESSDDVVARPEWNNLQVRRKQPQNIRFDNVLALDTLYVAGVATKLSAGDKLLFTFAQDASSAAMRTVASIDTQFVDQRTAIALQPLGPVLECEPLLAALIEQLKVLAAGGASGAASRALVEAQQIFTDVYLGTAADPALWARAIREAADSGEGSPVTDAIDTMAAAIAAIIPPDKTKEVTDPSKFVQPLLVPPVVQARNSLSLPRSLAHAFAPVGTLSSSRERAIRLADAPANAAGAAVFARRYADVSTQLLVSFVPHLEQSYYAAWEGAQVNPTTAPLSPCMPCVRARHSSERRPRSCRRTPFRAIPTCRLERRLVWSSRKSSGRTGTTQTMRRRRMRSSTARTRRSCPGAMPSLSSTAIGRCSALRKRRPRRAQRMGSAASPPRWRSRQPAKADGARPATDRPSTIFAEPSCTCRAIRSR